jgi:hypothetical protein
MVSKRFSEQKGAQRQRSLNKFKGAMASCGSDLGGILKTRYGKSLLTSSGLQLGMLVFFLVFVCLL